MKMQRAEWNADLRRLKETLQILQSKQIDTQSSSTHNPAVSQRVPENVQSLNRFASLGPGAANDENVMEAEDTGSTTEMDEAHPAKTGETVFYDHLDLDDDDLGEYIELSYISYT